jgi:DNA-directed RNA polymerase subunit beta'
VKADKVEKNYERGVISDGERREELIDIWTDATNAVDDDMKAGFAQQPSNSINMMVTSGARGNWMQIRQLAGMRGLVANPKGETIPRPIKSSFREGLSVLEFFISTHGARKGLADTALRTADSGYLTRRLVDVSQDVIIRDIDCGTERGLRLPLADQVGDDSWRLREDVETSVLARSLAQDVVGEDGQVLAARGDDVTSAMVETLLASGVTELRLRSVLTCESPTGVCATCYGRSMASGHRVDVGEAVGIIAAQSIGEPGTQLTMRTFHTGGVAGEDITHGLPRVVELFEARAPKGKAPISEVAGRVRFDPEGPKGARLVIVPDDGSDEIDYPISRRISEFPRNRSAGIAQWRVQDGDSVAVGEQLHAGTRDPHDVLRILGVRAVQQFLTDEVQEVYRSQGVSIHDKHIEIIVRQMLRRITVLESGDADLVPGDLVERMQFERTNREVLLEGGRPAAGRPQLMGITKASLATESWLSAASFQETTRVLTEAAISAKSDPLLGLKENVILGKLIPAGTGLAQYRNIRVEPTEEAKAAMYSLPEYASDYSEFTFGAGTGEAIRLEDYDLGSYS